MSSVTNFNLVMNTFLYQNNANIFFNKFISVYKAVFDIGLCLRKLVRCSRFLLEYDVCNLDGNIFVTI